MIFNSDETASFPGNRFCKRSLKSSFASNTTDGSFAGVDVHILPSANDIQFDDRRQAKWSDLSETATLVEGAYRASSTYLAELVPPA